MKLFNRKDSAVIEYALSHIEEEFVARYSDTTANADTLKKAYKEINTNKTKSKIAVNSGDGTPTTPLKPIEPKYELDKNSEIKKVEEPKNSIKKATSIKEVAKKAENLAKGTKAAKEVKVVEKPAKEGEISKRSVIKSLLEKNPEMTNRQIKDEILKQFNSCYDSEISAVKKQFQ